MKFPYFVAQQRHGNWVAWSNELHAQAYGSTKKEAIDKLKEDCKTAIIEKSVEMGEMEI